MHKMRICTRAHIDLFIYLSTCMYIMRVYRHTDVCPCIYTSMHVYRNIDMHVYIHSRAHIHTSLYLPVEIHLRPHKHRYGMEGGRCPSIEEGSLSLPRRHRASTAKEGKRVKQAFEAPQSSPIKNAST